MPPIQLPDERDRSIAGLEQQLPEEFALDTLDENPEMVENADGSVTLLAPQAAEQQDEFSSNLAETIDPHELRALGTALLELIDRDKDARKERDKQYEEGIRRTGLGDDAPGGADFPGASRAVHPVLAESCIDFAARAMKELCPPDGPVRTKLKPPADEAKLLRAQRKRDFLNKLFTRDIEEYYPEKEQLLTQAPLGGSQYEKYWYDPAQARIVMEFVPVDDVFLPYAATSFYTSPRITHRQKITRQQFEERVESGFYRDLGRVPAEGMEPEPTAAGAASDKVEGREATGYNEDGLRVIFEVQVARKLDDDRFSEGALAPYIVHIDDDSQEVLAVYRNWDERDALRRKLAWWVEDKFIPWRGAYGIGLLHLIGSLAGSATGALRALLDSAHVNNNPAALKLKGGRGAGQNLSLLQAGLTEIDSGGTDDIRKAVMAMPFNPPSMVLFQLLEWITNQAKGVVATAEEKIADASNQMPVGTALALIEQGSQVFSSIHSRLHDAQRRALRIVCRLVRDNYPDEALAKEGLTRQDFADESDIEPVSDPHIFSEAQRFAQLQEELKLAGMTPELNWNRRALARRGLELMRVDNVDDVLPKEPDPITSDPVQENQAVLLGAQLRAAPQQDHPAHIGAHFKLLANPLVMTMFDPQILAVLLQHIKQHFAMHYGTLAQQAAQQALQMVVEAGKPISPDGMAAAASNKALDAASQEMAQFAQMLKAVQDQIKEKLPPEPMDPGTAAFKAAMAEVERKSALDKATAAAKSQELELKPLLTRMTEETKTAIAQLREQSAGEQERLRQQVELIKNQQDNEQHHATELAKNLSDNMTQIRIAMETNMQDALNGIREQYAADKAQAPQSITIASPSDGKLDALLQAMQGMMQAMSAETEFVLDEEGNPIGARRKLN